MNTLRFLSTWLLTNIMILTVSGCSPKTTPLTEQDKEFTKIRIENIVENEGGAVITPAASGKDTCKKWGRDSASTVKNLSLYKEYFKQDNYVDAYPFWIWMIKNAPCYSKGIYIDGAKILDYHIKNEKDKVKTGKYIDTLMMIYDQRIAYFGERGFVLGVKGRDLFTMRPEDYEKAYAYLKESIELEGNNSNKTIPYYFMFASTNMFKNAKITEMDLVDNFLKCTDIVDANVSKGGTDADEWNKVMDNITSVTGAYLKCETLIPSFKKAYASNPNNAALIIKMQKVLESNKCTQDAFFGTLSEKAIELSPSAKSASSLALYFYSNQNYAKAATYFSKAVDLADSNSDKAKYAIFLSKAYREAGNYPAARTAAQRAAAFNPNDGEPYIIIGDLYAASAGNCGSGFSSKAVYWAAVDQYIIARNKGNGDAAERISKYSAYFPTKEEAFYQDPPVFEGNPYSIGCWIGVNTTARFIK